MEKLSIQRVPFTKEADNKLRAIKAKTGITPNVLCRIGFCTSLERKIEPPAIGDVERGREINRYTLLGQYDQLFELLLLQWIRETESSLPPDELLIRHMNHGTQLINHTNFL